MPYLIQYDSAAQENSPVAVVVSCRGGAGQRPRGRRVLGQFVRTHLPGCRTLLFPEGLLRRPWLRLGVALQAACRSGVQEFGDGPPGTGAARAEDRARGLHLSEIRRYTSRLSSYPAHSRNICRQYDSDVQAKCGS